jgi:hypothetical protein
MVDTGIFVLLQVGKLFLSHVDHDCVLPSTEKREEVSMRKGSRSGVVEVCVPRPWNLSLSRHVSKFLEDATPRLPETPSHVILLRLAPTLSKRRRDKARTVETPTQDLNVSIRADVSQRPRLVTMNG